MEYAFRQKVLFRHCDPAGIVFFPCYFEMMNDCVEAFFDAALDYDFEALHRDGGVPTAQIETRFVRPSRHGDMLTLRLELTRIGRSSAEYRMTAHCSEELRFEARATLVHVDLGGKPTRWPEALREKMKLFEARIDA